MKGGVDIILVQQDFDRWSANAQIPDVRPMAYLSGCVVSLGDYQGVGLVQLVVQGAGIMVAMDVVRGVDDDAAFFLALDESDGGTGKCRR